MYSCSFLLTDVLCLCLHFLFAEVIETVMTKWGEGAAGTTGKGVQQITKMKGQKLQSPIEEKIHLLMRSEKIVG